MQILNVKNKKKVFLYPPIKVSPASFLLSRLGVLKFHLAVSFYKWISQSCSSKKVKATRCNFCQFISRKTLGDYRKTTFSLCI